MGELVYFRRDYILKYAFEIIPIYSVGILVVADFLHDLPGDAGGSS